jgi:hypothetical protein
MRSEEILRQTFSAVLSLGIITALGLPALAESSPTVKEQVIVGPHEVPIKVRMEGPYTASTTLQVVCYFKYSDVIARKMSGGPVELDKRRGGAINSLRTRGEFRGEPSAHYSFQFV